MTPSDALASHFTATTFTAIPAALVTEMKRLYLDYLGVALSGSRTMTGGLVGDFVAEMGGTREATVLGRAVRVPAVHAAFANAVAEHSVELDDIDEEALFHYGPPVVSAALAVGQRQSASGAELITATLAGCEMMNRLSRATNPYLRDRGFHTTPTCGVFGAAVSAGRLLELTTEQMTSALGLAGAQASGLMEMYGPSMQKRINPGPAARGGVTAAVLAGKGYTGADTIIEGERGFGAAFSGRLDTERLLAGLGKEIPVVVEYKPYSSARPIHNAIDCVLQIRASRPVASADIEHVVVYRHPAWADYHGNDHPTTYHEAQVSLPYSVAVAFHDGAALPEQYRDDRLREPALQTLTRRVAVRPDDTLPRGVSCRMVVELVGGDRAEAQIDYPKGSVQNPMTDRELADKFRMLAGPCLPTDRVDEIIAQLNVLEYLDDVNALVDLTA